MAPLLLLFFLVTVPAFTVVNGNTMVSGTVFCDQCLDGRLSFFDYPLSGAKVAVTCNGTVPGITGEANSNWAGNWAVRFEGRPDLSGCEAKVVAAPAGCPAAVAQGRGLSLVFDMFGMELYAVGPLFAQPTKPMRLCRRGKPSPAPVFWPRPPVQTPAPPPPPPQMLPLLPPPNGSPAPVPFFEASACPFYKWMMPEYKCYWKVLQPEMPVALAFGPVAAGKYGTRMTLWQGLHGKGDLYQTLLREGITALLNSYHSATFLYPTLTVISDMNLALLGSQRQALTMALRFRRANSGFVSGHNFITCNFNACS